MAQDWPTVWKPKPSYFKTWQDTSPENKTAMLSDLRELLCVQLEKYLHDAST